MSRSWWGRGVGTVGPRRVCGPDSAELLLFTDRANATGNALHQRVGYRRPVEDHLAVEFGAGERDGVAEGLPEVGGGEGAGPRRA
ncbi:hypothetical protein [Streptomyces sp. NPDC093097]|uniref:hypothetical protein n=1 Tax=Streptomyces sp. NPDC093097 TaxID=3366027 RepID=UPI00381234A3